VKLLIVSPAQVQNDGSPLKVEKAFLIPLSVYLLAGLTPKDWEIRIVNDYTDTIPYDEHFDLVGITSTTLHSRRGYQIASEFKKRGKKVVMGGFHPTLFTQEALENCDSVVVGEAECVWEEVLSDAAGGSLKPKYQAEQFHDLKGLPVPRFDLLDKKKFMNDVMPIEASRGCPYNCDFCSVTQFYGRKYRFRPAAEVVRDIKETKSTFVGFVDDNIAGRLDYSEELFEALIPEKVFWMSQVSIKLADDERILALSAKSGFRYAIIGIETLNEKNLADVGKRNVNRVEEYVSKTRLFKKHGISIAANLMFGFDNDTEEAFDKTYDFVVANRFLPNPYILTPYPGTRLFDRMNEAGRMLHTDFWKYTSYQAVFKPVNFTPERLDSLFLDFYKRVYSYPNIAKRFFHMLRFKFSFGHVMTQIALAFNSLQVRKNLRNGILPYF
jgi:radical SAM superfamily enzyme YgiQ (UPF0313 family)